MDIVSRLHAEGLEKAPPQEWFLQVLEAYLRDRLDSEIDLLRSELQRWEGPAPPTELLTGLQELQKQSTNLPKELRQRMQDEPESE